jgi:tRNA pseudouridine38-40 synthase
VTLFEDEPVVVPPSPSLRVRANVAYDGSGYSGFALQGQEGVRTVAGEIVAALGKVLGHSVELDVAGRTDKGVHAQGQVISFDVIEGTDLARVEKAMIRMLGPRIVVSGLTVAESDFHARFSASARLYRYSVLNRSAPDPFLASTSWWVPEPLPLDLAGMRAACYPLIGEHDFSSFCRRPDPDKDLTRRVVDARWEDTGDGLLHFWIEANAFCHQMVRSVVAALVSVGRGRRTAADVAEILRARDRSVAPSPAPPGGLCLWQVRYERPPKG